MHQSLPKKVYPQPNTKKLLVNVLKTAIMLSNYLQHFVLRELKSKLKPKPTYFWQNYLLQKITKLSIIVLKTPNWYYWKLIFYIFQDFFPNLTSRSFTKNNLGFCEKRLGPTFTGSNKALIKQIVQCTQKYQNVNTSIKMYSKV